MTGTPPTTSSVLLWPKRVLSADDLRRHLTGQRELVLLPRTVVTPLAADELKAKGVRIRWQTPGLAEAIPVKSSTWIYAQEKQDAVVAAAMQALHREGIELAAVEFASVRCLAEQIMAGQRGGVLFASDPATACCLANKIAGIRAASAWNAMQVVRINKNLAANLFAIEMPGRTFFEVRHMVKSIVTGATTCPEPIATLLKELDGHAHR